MKDSIDLIVGLNHARRTFIASMKLTEARHGLRLLKDIRRFINNIPG